MSNNKMKDLVGVGINAERVRAIAGNAYADDNISSSDAPSLAELNTAFGAATSVPAGYVAVIDDNGAGTNSVLCWSDGTNWFYVAGTKAS